MQWCTWPAWWLPLALSRKMWLEPSPSTRSSNSALSRMPLATPWRSGSLQGLETQALEHNKASGCLAGSLTLLDFLASGPSPAAACPLFSSSPGRFEAIVVVGNRLDSGKREESEFAGTEKKPKSKRKQKNTDSASRLRRVSLKRQVYCCDVMRRSKHNQCFQLMSSITRNEVL